MGECYLVVEDEGESRKEKRRKEAGQKKTNGGREGGQGKVRLL